MSEAQSVIRNLAILITGGMEVPMIACSNPQCQTTAGCVCQRIPQGAWHGFWPPNHLSNIGQPSLEQRVAQLEQELRELKMKWDFS